MCYILKLLIILQIFLDNKRMFTKLHLTSRNIKRLRYEN